MQISHRIILDLKNMEIDQALEKVAQTKNLITTFKGHSLFDEYGLKPTTRKLIDSGAELVWADYKLHDTPDTVAERAKKIRDAGVHMLTVHAAGGPEMIEAAVKNGPPIIIAVTILSSLKNEFANKLFGQTPDAVALNLALTAWHSGAKAIVCSPKQVTAISQNSLLGSLLFIVPGTRSVGAAHHDQQNVKTPYNTILNGADFLVGGRQVTQDPDPITALNSLISEITPAIDIRRKQRQDWLLNFSG